MMVMLKSADIYGCVYNIRAKNADFNGVCV